MANEDPKSPEAGATSGRVLQRFEHDGETYNPNDLFEGDKGTVARKHAAGLIDAHPDAVPYAKKRAAAKKASAKE